MCNFDRIIESVNAASLDTKTVAVIGCGAIADGVLQLARCGVRRWILNDIDLLGAENICRQGYYPDQIGLPKVEALKQNLKRLLGDDLNCRAIHRNFIGCSEGELEELFQGCDAVIAAADNQAAKHLANRIAILLGVPLVSVGSYEGGGAGEVFWFDPTIAGLSCYAEMFPTRKDQAAIKPNASSGITILDTGLIDSIGMAVVIGLLTKGSDSRFGRLLQQLRRRQFLQVILEPSWNYDGRDTVREALGIGESQPNYFAYCTAAREDPAPAGLCNYCLKHKPQSNPTQEM
jgi:sulfur carrier protein ThiS adenylyltransferase